MQTIFACNSPEGMVVPTTNWDTFYVPLPSDFGTPRQRFAVVPNDLYSSMNAANGYTVEEFEVYVDGLSDHIIELPSYDQAGDGLCFSVLLPTDFDALD